MKNLKNHLFVVVFGAAALVNCPGQIFERPPTVPSLGNLNVVDADQDVDLPPDGRLYYETVRVAANRTLRFNRNGLNTPVYLLVQGSVVVNGTIDVSGVPAQSSPPFLPGIGGPGGFDGGKPSFGSTSPPGDGYGPGAGGAGNEGNGAGSAGAASHAGQANPSLSGSALKGAIYGSPLLIPLLGGSGGGGGSGTPGIGGGGGGGALLIASNIRIEVTATGSILSLGANASPFARMNGGSGGAIRLLAPLVAGTGQINVSGGNEGGSGGAGRMRIDCIDKSELQLGFVPLAVTTVGSNMFVEPEVVPRLDIEKVAGDFIPPNANGTVRIHLPLGSNPNVGVALRAQDFGADIPIRLTLTPDSGSRIVIDTNIDNTTVNPARITIPVTLPINTLVTIHAWTR